VTPKTSALWGSVCLLLLGITCVAPLLAHDSTKTVQTTALKVVELREPDAQILSYRHLASSTDVHMRGTKLAPEARVKLKIGSRPGFVELDINRGGITGLKPAYYLGKDFLTYVLWAISVDGRASNLGEITFERDEAVAVNVTTPYQTFWLMITAEPHFAVVDPSSAIVLYSVKQGATSQSRAIPVSGDVFYFTHYSSYESASAGEPPILPNQLLQARKAWQLATKSVALVPPHPGSAPKEEQYTRQALNQAKSFLELAEDSYRRDPRGRDVIQFARTAAQSAENARALAMGVVGGVRDRQLENELISVRAELEKLRAAQPPGDSGAEDPVTTPPPPPPPAVVAPVPAATPLLKQPALWFAAGGWALAIVLLFRRRSG
jgi:hypothetical protein